MKYKIDDYVANDNTVLLKVIVAIPGIFEIYALRSIKSPTELRWYTLEELEHEAMTLTTYRPEEFLQAEPGDSIRCGTEEYKQILAKQGNALLVSRSTDKNARAFVNMLSAAVGPNGEKIPEETISHLKSHTSQRMAASSVDSWYDIEVMALMNWHLVKE